MLPIQSSPLSSLFAHPLTSITTSSSIWQFGDNKKPTKKLKINLPGSSRSPLLLSILSMPSVQLFAPSTPAALPISSVHSSVSRSRLSVRPTPLYALVSISPHFLKTIIPTTKAENIDKTFGHQKQFKIIKPHILIWISLLAWISFLDLYWIRICSVSPAVYDSSLGVPPWPLPPLCRHYPPPSFCSSGSSFNLPVHLHLFSVIPQTIFDIHPLISQSSFPISPHTPCSIPIPRNFPSFRPCQSPSGLSPTPPLPTSPRMQPIPFLARSRPLLSEVRRPSTCYLGPRLCSFASGSFTASHSPSFPF